MSLDRIILLIIFVLILLAVLHRIFFPRERKGYVVKVRDKEFFFDSEYEAESMANYFKILLCSFPEIEKEDKEVFVYEYKFNNGAEKQ